MSAYHWTESKAEIARLIGLADALEIAPCRDCGSGEIERCDGDKADLFSVYFHFTPDWDGDPNELAGALCIADRATLAEAQNFADALSQRSGLPINDFT